MRRQTPLGENPGKEEQHMRYSSNNYTAKGDLVNGFDYKLQVWVADEMVMPCGHPETMRADGPCCNAATYAGRVVATIPGHDEDN